MKHEGYRRDEIVTVRDEFLGAKLGAGVSRDVLLQSADGWNDDHQHSRLEFDLELARRPLQTVNSLLFGAFGFGLARQPTSTKHQARRRSSDSTRHLTTHATQTNGTFNTLSASVRRRALHSRCFLRCADSPSCVLHNTRLRLDAFFLFPSRHGA